MKLSKSRLAEIIKEEVSALQRRRVAEEEDAGDAVKQTGDVEKIAARAQKMLAPLFEKINSEQEFREVMTVFLQMASQKIKPNTVKKVLANLAREATQ